MTVIPNEGILLQVPIPCHHGDGAVAIMLTVARVNCDASFEHICVPWHVRLLQSTQGNQKSLRLPAWHPTPRALPRPLAPAASLACAATTIGRNQNRPRWIRSLGGRTDRIVP